MALLIMFQALSDRKMNKVACGFAAIAAITGLAGCVASEPMIDPQATADRMNAYFREHRIRATPDNSLRVPQNASSSKSQLHGDADIAWRQNDFKTAIPLYRQACQNGDPAACRRVALCYDEKPCGLSQDYVKAATYYKQACDRGDAFSCSNLGVLHASGQGVKRDLKKAFHLYQKGCDTLRENIGMSCFNLAQAYDKGQGVGQDSGKAYHYWSKSCDLDYAKGCYNLGVAHQLVGVYDRATANFRKACGIGLQIACERLRTAR
jgi:TPR repeat protein